MYPSSSERDTLDNPCSASFRAHAHVCDNVCLWCACAGLLVAPQVDAISDARKHSCLVRHFLTACRVGRPSYVFWGLPVVFLHALPECHRNFTRIWPEFNRIQQNFTRNAPESRIGAPWKRGKPQISLPTACLIIAININTNSNNNNNNSYYYEY